MGDKKTCRFNITYKNLLKERLLANTYYNVREFKMQCFTCSNLTSVDEGSDMQIWRWGAQIDDKKVDQRRWREARNKRKDKGKKKGNSWEANARKRWGKDRSTPAGLFCFLDEKSLPLISRSGLLSRSRSLPPPTGIIKTGEIRERRIEP